MDARLYRRARRSLTGLLVGAFVAGGLWGAPLASARPDSASRADVPPQEPGVTLRVFDVQVPLEKICTLKPGQTPNVDKLMPTVDWSTTGDFGGFGDNFVTQVTGNIHVPADGSYTFRLSSDDGSRLLIGDQVADHVEGVVDSDRRVGGGREFQHRPRRQEKRIARRKLAAPFDAERRLDLGELRRVEVMAQRLCADDPHAHLAAVEPHVPPARELARRTR